MQSSTLLLVILALAIFSYFVASRRATGLRGKRGDARVTGNNSLPTHYGYLVALWCGIPALMVLVLWLGFQSTIIDSMVVSSIPAESAPVDETTSRLLINDLRNSIASDTLSSLSDQYKVDAANQLQRLQQINQMALTAVVLAAIVAGLVFGLRLIKPSIKARVLVERFINGLLILSASIAILTTVGIVISVLFESIRFFREVSFLDFVTGLKWSPQTAIRSDQVGSTGGFGAVPLFTGTLLISAIALIVAVPLGLMSAIYLAEYASQRVRSIVKPLLEILAGIPTVVYGFFAALTVAPAVRGFGESIGLSVASESALAAGVVMGIMIIPFVSSLSDDVITAVPRAMREGSYGLGATQSETIAKVVIPAALPGIVGSILLAASRAIGETMIVVMAAGLAANLTANPLQAVTTVTVQIVTLLTGDQEFDSAKTLAAFALGLMLFLVTLVLNVIALYVVRRYREQYE